MDHIKNITFEFERRMVENLERIQKCLNVLPQEKIWFSPNINSNSIGNILLHIEGNIHQYIISTLGGSPDKRQREVEFYKIHNLSKSILWNQIELTINQAIDVVKLFDLDNHNTLRSVQCYQETPISIIIHVTEHTSYHVGQIT